MELTTLITIFSILFLKQPSDIVQAIPRNITLQNESKTVVLDIEEKAVNVKTTDVKNDNENFKVVQKKSYDAHTYNTSTCKQVLQNNVKGRFNLSAHDLVCRYNILN
jgi:hypothetical protein